jgi:uncharacterized membrane protein YobD (UPF0266 family)
MSLVWVLVGSIVQMLLAYPLLMFALIAQGAWNGILFVLPFSCFFSAAIVIYFHNHGGTAASYLWYGLPIVLVLITYIVLPK